MWLGPGGHLEPDDLSLAGAAAREVAEETGIPFTVGAGTTVRLQAEEVNDHAWLPIADLQPAHLPGRVTAMLA